MIYIIVHALAPIFVIMLLGFWAGKAGMVDNKDVSLLNIFVMDFALPAAHGADLLARHCRPVAADCGAYRRHVDHLCGNLFSRHQSL